MYEEYLEKYMREYNLDKETAEQHAVVREVKKYYEEDNGEQIWL